MSRVSERLRNGRNTCLSPSTLTHPAVVSALVALVLTVLLYEDTLALPLFSDDLVLIPWLESVSWRELWSAPTIYALYYRPLWFTLWRIWGTLVGGLHPLGLHFLNVSAHFAAAWLAGLVAAAWIRPDVDEPNSDPSRGSVIPACLTAALFAAFPFSRQAVAWAGAVYNPLVSAMAAGALLAYDRGRRGHGRRWIGLALLLAALAPFTYETGILIGPLVVVTEGMNWLHRRWSRRSWWPLPFVGLLAVTALIFRLVRGVGMTTFGLHLPELQHNIAYLTQGLIYPLAPLTQRLVSWLGLDPRLSLWLIALPTLALLTWSGLRWNRDSFWLGAVWFALFSLPPLVTMEADWFTLAPRYLYLPAAGASLVWAAAVSPWLERLRLPWQPLVTGLLLVALLIPAVVFVHDGVRLYSMAGESIWDAAEAATCEHPILLVNLPRRITPHSRIYPLGFEGVTPLPMRVAPEELIYVHTGIRDAANAVAFGTIAVDDPPDYSYELFGEAVGLGRLEVAVRQTRAVYLTRYEPERIHLVEAGAVGEAISPNEPLARFGDHVTLLNAAGTCDDAGRVYLTAYWQVEESVEAQITVFAHLLSPDGARVAQADGYPLLGMHPFWVWKPGEIARDVRHFDPVPAGDYTVMLGIWEPATGERWPATEHPDGVLYLPVRCP